MSGTHKEVQDTQIAEKMQVSKKGSGVNLSILFAAGMVSAALIYSGMDSGEKHQVTCNVGGDSLDADDEIAECIKAAKYGLQEVGAHGSFKIDEQTHNHYPDVEDMDIHIIYNGHSVGAQAESRPICHIANDEDASLKMVTCRVYAREDGIDTDTIQYVFD